MDDSVDDLELIETLLVKTGCEVLTSHNGFKALAAASESLPDLIVCEILLPTMDGFTLCRKWPRDKQLQSIPFFFYTESDLEKIDREQTLKLGADGFLVKLMDEIAPWFNAHCTRVKSGSLQPFTQALWPPRLNH